MADLAANIVNAIQTGTPLLFSTADLATAPPPIGTGIKTFTIPISGMQPLSGASITQINTVAPGFSISALFPSGTGGNWNIFTQEDLGLTLQNVSVTTDQTVTTVFDVTFDFNVTSSGSPPTLLSLPNAQVTLVGFSITIAHPLDTSTSLQGSIFGSIQLSQEQDAAVFNYVVNLPELSLEVFLPNQDPLPNFGDILKGWNITNSIFSAFDLDEFYFSIDIVQDSIAGDISLVVEDGNAIEIGSTGIYVNTLSANMSYGGGLSLILSVGLQTQQTGGLLFQTQFNYDSTAQTWSIQGGLDVVGTLASNHDSGNTLYLSTILKDLFGSDTDTSDLLNDVGIEQLQIGATFLDDPSISQTTYTFLGEFVADWTFPGGYGASVDTTINLTTVTGSGGGTSGSIAAKLVIDGFEVDLTYAFGGSKVLTGALPAYGLNATYDVSTQDLKLSFTQTSLDLGTLLAQFVSMFSGNPYTTLPEPWDSLLNHQIELGNVTIDFDLAHGKTTLELSGLNISLLGITVNGVTLSYVGAAHRTGGGSGFSISLDAPGLTKLGVTQPSWDPVDPGTAPTVAGQGAAVVKVITMAAGQQLQLTPTPASVLAAMSQIETLIRGVPATQTPAAIPDFTSDAGWLIGLHLLIEGQMDIQFVFDDPTFYGAQVTVNQTPQPAGASGSKFIGALAGLSAEILYRKVNETVGVYEGKLTLPDATRNIDIGLFKLQLPTISADIYTDGEFDVDVGFPQKNNDFSQSASVQAGEYGGAGGIYFGRLSAANSGNLPSPRMNGNVALGGFGTATDIGIALQIGVYYGWSSGPLSASLSVQLTGVFQGVFADYTDYASQVTTEYYAVDASVTVSGQVSGSVNFVVISARFSVSVSMTAGVQAIAGQPVSVPVVAQLSVAASLTIGISPFSLTYNFSFSTSLNYQITFGDRTAVPWQETSLPRPVPLLREFDYLITDIMHGLEDLLPLDLNLHLAPLPHYQLELPLYLLPVLSRGNTPGTSDPSWVYVIQFALPGAPVASGNSFTDFAKLVFAWFTDAFNRARLQAGFESQQTFDGITTTLPDLVRLERYLHSQRAAAAMPSVDRIRQFFGSNLDLALTPQPVGALNAIPFPLLPSLNFNFMVDSSFVSKPDAEPEPVEHVLHDYLILVALSVIGYAKEVMTMPGPDRVSVNVLFERLANDPAAPLGQIAAMVTRFMLHGSRSLQGELVLPQYTATGQSFYFDPAGASALTLEVSIDAPLPSYGIAVFPPFSLTSTVQQLASPDQIGGFVTSPSPTPGEVTLLPQSVALPQAFALPAGGITTDTSGNPTGSLRAFSAALQQYLTSGGDLAGGFMLTDDTGTQPTTNYSWATKLSLTIQQTPPAAPQAIAPPELGGGTPATPPVYAIGSLCATDVTNLLALYEAAVSGSQGTPAITSVALLVPAGVNGQQMVLPIESGNAFIYLNNLSTQASPPSPDDGRFALLADGDAPGDLLFIARLLASALTNRGGYYLYVDNSGAGLPASAFDSNGVARISVLVNFAANTAGDVLQPYYTATVIADTGIDPAAPLQIQSQSLVAPRPSLPLGQIGFTSTITTVAASNDQYQTSLDGLLSLVGFALQVKNAQDEVVLDLTETPLTSSSSTLSIGVPGNTPYQQILDLLPVSSNPVAPLFNRPFPGGDLPHPSLLLQADADPYRFVNCSVSGDFCWVDLFGNLLDANAPFSSLIIDWTDPLQGLSAWPGLTYSYRVTTATAEKTPVLDLILSWSPPQGSVSQAQRANLMLQYARLYHQLNYTSVSLTTSLVQSPITMLFNPAPSVAVALQNRIRLILDALYLHDPVTIPLEPLVFPLAPDLNPYNPALFYELFASLSFQLDPSLPVASGPGSLDTTTVLAPLHRSASGDGSLSFKLFAEDLEEAFSSISLKLMQGDTSDAQSPNFWIWRFGSSGMQIALQALNHGSDVGYSPPPLFTQLMSADSIAWSANNLMSLNNSFIQSGTLQVSDFDLDASMDHFLGALDAMLAPSQGVPAAIANAGDVSSLLSAKLVLAQQLPMQVRSQANAADSDDGIAKAMAAYQQAMLKTAASYYDIDAVTVIRATAEAAAAVPDFMLFGHLVNGSVPTGVATASPVSCQFQNGSGLFAASIDVLHKGDIDRYGLPAGLRIDAVQVNQQQYPIDIAGTGLAGAPDYTVGTWLHFVIPPGQPLPVPSEAIGLPLRSYPRLPVLTLQSFGTDPVQVKGEDALQQAMHWALSCTYQHNYVAQDTVQAQFVINEPAQTSTTVAAPYDVLCALAQFEALYPQLLPYIGTALGNNFSTPSQTTLDAIQAFAALAQTVAASLIGPVSPPPGFRLSDNSQSWQFEITEGPAGDDPLQSPWNVVVRSSPSNPGPATMLVDIPGCVTVLPPTDQLADGNGPVVLTYTIDGQPLLGQQAMAIAARTASLCGALDILSAQNGQVYISVERNKYVGLLDQQFPDEYLYATPQVTFTGPVMPILANAAPINMLTLNQVTEASTLTSVLTSFLTELVQCGGTPLEANVMVQLSASVRWPLQPPASGFALPMVTQPILLQIAQQYLVNGPPGDMQPSAAAIADAVGTWAKNAGVTPGFWTTAQLAFDVALFSPTSASGAPLLTLTDIYLPMNGITV